MEKRMLNSIYGITARNRIIKDYLFKLKNILEMKQLIAGYMGKAKDFKIENIIVKGKIKKGGIKQC